MLVYSPYKPLGLSPLESSPGLLSWMQGRWDSCDMPPLTPTSCASEVPLCGVSTHCSWNTGPHHCPQVPNCSCYSWLICHRRKQHTALKPCGKENKKYLDRTQSFLTPYGSRMWHPFVQPNCDLGEKSRKLKNVWEASMLCIVFLAFFIQQMFPEGLIYSQCWEVWGWY